MSLAFKDMYQARIAGRTSLTSSWSGRWNGGLVGHAPLAAERRDVSLLWKLVK